MEILLNDLRATDNYVTVNFTNGELVSVFDTKLARYVAEDLVVTNGLVQIPTEYDSYDAWLTLECSEGVEEINIVRPYVEPTAIVNKHGVTLAAAKELERQARFIIDSHTRGFKFWLGLEEMIGQGGDVLPMTVRIVKPIRLWENSKLVYNIDNQDINECVLRPTRNHYGLIADIGEAPWIDQTRTSYNVTNYPDQSGYFSYYFDYYLEASFGWPMIPQAVKDAAALIVADLQCGNINLTASYIERKTNDLGSISMNKAAFRGTGNFYADKLLDPYVESFGRVAII